mmetsp:Transcript_10893/g.26674  ORF Transcript_10893/g.26674 Transcript_10893/m.26674 type:complete len:190 (-) Transcript_10893:195-764(-)
MAGAAASRSVVCLLVLGLALAEPKVDDAKEEVEGWMQKQVPGVLGKSFMEKVSCEKFYKHFDAKFPDYYKENPEKTKMHVVSLCKTQRQVERDRRDLQVYAVQYFKDPEETELSTCAEFAEDFLSEYPKFKGEKGEAEAYCYFFREEGNMDALRQVQKEHKDKTRTMEDAIKTAKQIHKEQIVDKGREL